MCWLIFLLDSHLNFCVSAILQAATSATIAAVAAGHVENQNMLLAEGAVK